MRNSNEISLELDAKLRELEACQEVAQRTALAEEVNGLTRDLQEAQIDPDDPNYLRVVYNAKLVSEEHVVNHVNFAIGELVDDDLVPYLKPLTLLTE